MSTHPATEQIADYVYGHLSSAEAAMVEEHLSQCRDCAWQGQRQTIEMNRFSRALSHRPPDGLASRILRAGPARPRMSWLPFAAAVAVFSAGSVGIAVWQRTAMQGTIKQLEDKVATLSAARDEEQDGFSKALDGLCRVEMERNAAEMIAWAKVDGPREERVRDALLAAASATADVLVRASKGEIDIAQILTVDTLGGIESELRATLEEQEYSAALGRLDRRSREFAERAAREFLDDLGASVDITGEQRGQLASFLIERTAWRRDETLLPDFVRHQLCATLMKDGDALSSETRKSIRLDQAGKVMAYLDRAQGNYRRQWSRLNHR